MEGPRALWNVVHGSPANDPASPSIDDVPLPSSAQAATNGGTSATPGMAWMAHEIRGPLIVARATVERVIATEIAQDNRLLLQRSLANLDRLMGSVDRILDWACGGLIAGHHPVDLSAVVRGAVEAVPTDERTGLLMVSVPERLLIVGDEARLSIAVTNLIRNAVRYSPPDGTIEVALERSGAWASLRVDDDGPGVAEDERELIFAPLVRGRAGRRDESGRGLGLFMARQAIEELGGRIWVESHGTGSSFRILLPMPGKGEAVSGS